MFIFSRLLRVDERHLPIVEKEALAVVESCRKFRPFLLIQQFQLFTDNQALQHTLDSPRITNKLCRWRLELMEFTYQIHYKRSKENVAADSLTRCLLKISDADTTSLLRQEQ